MTSNTGFYEHYKRIMGLLLSHGVTDHNERTGHGILVLRGGYSFALEMSDGVLPVPGTRKVYPRSAAAEVAWWILGTRHVDFIQKYTPMWDKFVEADGHTIAAAYGYRWKHHFGRNQLRLAIDQLFKDPSNRQIIVCAWDPGSDALGAPAKKNVPCPLLFHLSSLPIPARRREVCMQVLKRSTDCFVGLPYDVMGYALLLQAIVLELNNIQVGNLGPTNRWTLGTLTFHLDHPHLYDSHFEATKKMLNAPHNFIEPRLPKFALQHIENMPEDYVAAVHKIQKAMIQPEFDYKPEVIE
jgi:thymidylate synthase